MSAKIYSCGSCDEKITRLMNYCPSCGEEQTWEDENDNDECYYCETEVHRKFNYCYACGEDIEPEGWNDPISRAKGFNLKWECDNDECDGLLQEFMSYCPWCGEEQTWDEFYSYKYTCRNCDASVAPDWKYCPFCGEKPFKVPLSDKIFGYGKKPGEFSREGVHTCLNHSSAQEGPVRVQLKRGQKLPPCPVCGYRARWMRGK